MNWRPWSWGYRQFEVELVSLHFMFKGIPRKQWWSGVLIKKHWTPASCSWGSSAWTKRWFLCGTSWFYKLVLCREIPTWQGRLVGHSWTDFPECAKNLREIGIEEIGLRLGEEIFRTNTMLFAFMCNADCCAWSQTNVLRYKVIFLKNPSLPAYLCVQVMFVSCWQ